jgi:hypothetical protein
MICYQELRYQAGIVAENEYRRSVESLGEFVEKCGGDVGRGPVVFWMMRGFPAKGIVAM